MAVNSCKRRAHIYTRMLRKRLGRRFFQPKYSTMASCQLFDHKCETARVMFDFVCIANQFRVKGHQRLVCCSSLSYLLIVSSSFLFFRLINFCHPLGSYYLLKFCGICSFFVLSNHHIQCVC